MEALFRGRPVEGDPWVRMDHVEKHLRASERSRGVEGFQAATVQDMIDLVPFLCLPLPFGQIEKEIGWSRGLVAHGWVRIRDLMGLASCRGGPMGRLALMRILLGIDPCFCDSEK